MNRIRQITVAGLGLLIAAAVFAQQTARPADPGLLTLDTVFTYRAQSLEALQWQEDGSGYLVLEPAPGKENALNIVRYDAASGEKTILVSAERLLSTGASSPLVVEHFDLSADTQK